MEDIIHRFGVPNRIVTDCHTRFYKENQMHLICAPGSELHTHDR
jgi:hypothetical protein